VSGPFELLVADFVPTLMCEKLVLFQHPSFMWDADVKYGAESSLDVAYIAGLVINQIILILE
jgi:hypothetical protein